MMVDQRPRARQAPAVGSLLMDVAKLSKDAPGVQRLQ